MRTDTQIQHDVMEQLRYEPTIKAEEIGVGVTDGVVRLSGSVDSLWKKWAAERAAERVFGVRAVAEDIKVKLPGPLARSDEDIARAASQVFEWNVLVPHESIKMNVEHGIVTMNGEVDYW